MEAPSALLRKQYWIILAAVTVATIQVAVILTRRKKLKADHIRHKEGSAFSACIEAWQLRAQRNDDWLLLLAEVTVAVSLIAMGVGALLWIAIIPFLIVAGPTMMFTVVSFLLRRQK